VRARCAESVFWIAVRLDMLLCDFCYQAAQVLASDIRCAGSQLGIPARTRSWWPGSLPGLAPTSTSARPALSWICATPSTWDDWAAAG
jgi:hypothetical protein